MIIHIILTAINTLCIIYLILSKNSKITIEFRKEKSFSNRTLLGYEVMLWRKNSDYSSSGSRLIYIKIRDKKKVETQEEVLRMIGKYSDQQKRQTLSAKFSWLKTIEEVKQFEKDYSVVDRKLVADLVSGFKYT